MPLAFYHLDAEREVGVWKATESEAFFTASLEAQYFDLKPALAIRHPEKRRQWYASRYLLLLMYPSAIALYTEGKPYLFNGPFLSFSHGGNLVAVLLSHANAGIDVQHVDPKLELIAKKFLAPNDLEVMNYPNIRLNDALCIIWSIKEAVFKTYGTGLPFKQIALVDYQTELGLAEVAITNASRKAAHQLRVHRVEGGFLAYLLK